MPDRFLRNIPVRRKVILIIMLVTGGALLLAGAALVLSERWRFRSEMVADLGTLGDIIARNSTASVTFRDPDAANETLAALKARKPIVAAAIYPLDASLLGTYYRDGKKSPLPGRPGPRETVFRDDSLGVFRPILLGEQRIGTVYLQSDFSEIAARQRVQTATVVAVFLVSSLAALLFSSRLQQVISRPILHLSETARSVSERRDYSIRAQKRGSDEIGQLVDAFNQMLEQIQGRDSELLRAKEELEKRVQERTLELRQELAERRRAERELAERNEELHRSNQDLDDFAYIASHDLKEPLRGIHNYSVFLLEDYGERSTPTGCPSSRRSPG